MSFRFKIDMAAVVQITLNNIELHYIALHFVICSVPHPTLIDVKSLIFQSKSFLFLLIFAVIEFCCDLYPQVMLQQSWPAC